MKAGFHWIVEVARCCGRKFRRAHLPHRPLPGTHLARCPKCGDELLYWQASEQMARAAKNERQQRARGALVSVGLTTKGTVRRHRYYHELAGLRGQERRNAWWAIRRRELRAAGLTARGTVRKLAVRTASPQWALLAAIRAEIPAEDPLPVACGFRDSCLDERFAASGRANKGNYAGFNLNKQEAA